VEKVFLISSEKWEKNGNIVTKYSFVLFFFILKIFAKNTADLHWEKFTNLLLKMAKF
jgi:hypothetical protein